MLIKLAVAGDGTNACHLTKVRFDIGWVSEEGTFSSNAYTEATPNISEVSTTYKEFSGQCYINSISEFASSRAINFACRIRVYGYVAAGTGGKIKIIHRRGETNTQIIVFINPAGI